MLHEWLVALLVMVLVVGALEYLFHRKAVNTKFQSMEQRVIGLERKLRS